MPAPLENPIKAPIQLHPGETPSSRAAAQQQALDPAAIGQHLHEQAANQQGEGLEGAGGPAPQAPGGSSTDLQIAQTLAQTQAAMAQMAENMTRLQQGQAPAAPEPTGPMTLGDLNPQDFQLSPEARAQLGDVLPEELDKRAKYHATEIANKALAMMQEQHNQQLQGLQTTIDELRQGQTQLQTSNKAQFEAQTRMAAMSAGLDPDRAAADPVWQKMLQEVADPVRGVTYSQYLANAMANMHSTEMASIFNLYAQRKAAEQQANPAIAPVVPGGGAHFGAPPAQDPAAAVHAQMAELLQQKTALHQQRFSTQISAVDFETQAHAIQQKLDALQAQLPNAAAG